MPPYRFSEIGLFYEKSLIQSAVGPSATAKWEWGIQGGVLRPPMYWDMSALPRHKNINSLNAVDFYFSLAAMKHAWHLLRQQLTLMN